MNIRSYPKVYNLGHKAIVELFDDEVTVEEKIDGSQFSFGLVKGEDNKYKLQCRSHHQIIDMSNVPKMFGKAVETARYFNRNFNLVGLIDVNILRNLNIMF